MVLYPPPGFPLTATLRLCRIIHGVGEIQARPTLSPQAIAALVEEVDAGYTTWNLVNDDGAAWLGEWLNQWRAMRGTGNMPQIQALTHWHPSPWVPHSGQLTRAMVEANLERSRRRLGVECLDLVQVQWPDYRDASYVDALKYLVDLKAEGKIAHLGLSNFDTDHLCFLLDQGIPLVSNQVQVSLVDQRALIKLASFCKVQNVSILAYGSLCGGFLSDRYLGQPEPEDWALTTGSQRHYKRLIDAWGGWELFQMLLRVLRAIADRHRPEQTNAAQDAALGGTAPYFSIANVAVRAILDIPTVAGVVVGSRLGPCDYRDFNRRAFELNLDSLDYEQIRQVQERSRDLYRLLGDCGDEYQPTD